MSGVQDIIKQAFFKYSFNIKCWRTGGWAELLYKIVCSDKYVFEQLSKKDGLKDSTGSG